MSNGNEYAVMNLRTIKENIAAYASYAEGHLYSDIYDKVEEVQSKIDELINYIENN